MEIRAIHDKQLWDSFVTSQPSHTFLHSWAWGEFSEAVGERIWRLGIYNGGSTMTNDNDAGLLAAALVIKVHARRGNFLFIPHGPIENQNSKIKTQNYISKFEIYEALFRELYVLAETERVSFIRVSPLLEDTEENQRLFRELGFRPAPMHMHAETTWTLDLALSEDELMMNMRKTTRNLIRRAKKDGVKVTSGTSAKDIETFYGLYRQTVKKHRFTPFSLTFLENQVKILSKDSAAEVFTARYRNRPLASAIIVFYGNSAFYHHGASIPGKIPAAYLLQWEAIREARRRGHKFYNFWGIVKQDAPASHPWQGITLFKKGFGGFQTDYLHAQDLPLSLWYWPSYILETLRKVRRHL